MDGEQTWPTEDEIQEAEENFQQIQKLKEAQTKFKVKRVPKGTSEYQAAWIIDSDEGM